MVREHQLIALMEQLERNVRQLKDAHELAKRRITELERDVSTLRTTNREQETTIKQLKKKQVDSQKNRTKSKDFGKIVHNNLSATDATTDLKQQLDEYIRELERCIAHLSSLS